MEMIIKNYKEEHKVTIHSVKESNESVVIPTGDYIVVDVRTPEEYKEGHVKGAINIPYDTIDKNVKLDKSKKIMVYCKSGTRSAIAYKTLTELGYDVYDLGAYEKLNFEKE